MTREDYLAAVFKLIQADARSVAGLKASTLGILILRELPGHWKTYGFWSLKELLQELERRSLVRLASDTQNALAVWPKEVAVAAPDRPPFKAWIPMRKDVWTAFVSALPLGRRFIERTSGAVRMSLYDTPQPPNQWVEIRRIGDEAQKAWAREFLDSVGAGSNGELREALGDASWYVKFPQTLRQTNLEWHYQWNRTRSERVFDHVQRWCTESSIDQTLVLQTPPRPTALLGAIAPPLSSNEGARKQVLDALTRMPTEELLNLSIPAKYWALDPHSNS